MQVHKEPVDVVPNSLPNRSNIELEIIGMKGIPREDFEAYVTASECGSTSNDNVAISAADGIIENKLHSFIKSTGL